MPEPGAQAMARVVPHRAQLGRSPERIGDTLGGPLAAPLVAKLTRTWQLSRIEWFRPYAFSI
jgi:hypothetical protein